MDQGIFGALVGIGGAVVGFIVSRWYAVAELRGRALARLEAIRAEIAECGIRAKTLCEIGETDFVGFALPDWIGREALGALASDGLLTESEARVLVGFYALVSDANMNLERARVATSSHLDSVVALDIARKKARHLVEGVGNHPAIRETQSVIAGAISEVMIWRWWHPFLARRL